MFLNLVLLHQARLVKMYSFNREAFQVQCGQVLKINYDRK